VKSESGKIILVTLRLYTVTYCHIYVFKGRPYKELYSFVKHRQVTNHLKFLKPENVINKNHELVTIMNSQLSYM